MSGQTDDDVQSGEISSDERAVVRAAWIDGAPMNFATQRAVVDWRDGKVARLVDVERLPQTVDPDLPRFNQDEKQQQRQ